jgi:hypothetical protein
MWYVSIIQDACANSLVLPFDDRHCGSDGLFWNSFGETISNLGLRHCFFWTLDDTIPFSAIFLHRQINMLSVRERGYRLSDLFSTMKIRHRYVFKCEQVMFFNILSDFGHSAWCLCNNSLKKLGMLSTFTTMCLWFFNVE